MLEHTQKESDPVFLLWHGPFSGLQFCVPVENDVAVSDRSIPPVVLAP